MHLTPYVSPVYLPGEQKMIEMVQRRGVHVVRLMENQHGGRDDRQLLLLPAEPPPPYKEGAPPQYQEGARRSTSVFPNVPYEEAKYT
jgi:hypothetical protein